MGKGARNMSNLEQNRIHIGVAVSDLTASIAFYSQILGVQPDKVRSDYARFTPLLPAVNFTLNLVDQVRAPEGPEHFGIQMKSPEDVHRAQERLEKAGLRPRPEKDVQCCYARQDKVWVVDPDGRSWEVFYTHEEQGAARDEAGACCEAPESGEACC